MKDKAVIVVGFSQGIGLAMADAFAAEGARRPLGARNEDRLRAAADGIRSRHEVEVIEKGFDVGAEDVIELFVN